MTWRRLFRQQVPPALKDVWLAALPRFSGHLCQAPVGSKEVKDDEGAALLYGRVQAKSELVHQKRYPTREAAKRHLFASIEGYYNRQPIHSALGYITPEQAQLRDA